MKIAIKFLVVISIFLNFALLACHHPSGIEDFDSYRRIIYNLNGGENNPNNKSGFIKSFGTLELFSATRQGYIFDGWFLDKEFTQQIAQINCETTYQDVLIWAKWTEDTGKPDDNSTDKPNDNPTDKPNDNPTDKPNDNPTDKPNDNPADKPNDNPTDKPNDNPTDKPNDNPTDKPNKNNSNIKWTIAIINNSSESDDFSIKSFESSGKISFTATNDCKNYTWSLDNASLNETSSTVTLELLNIEVGYHTIIVEATDSNGIKQFATCTFRKTESAYDKSAEIKITNNSTSASPIVIATSEESGSLNLEATSGFENYLWSVEGKVLDATTNIATVSLSTLSCGYCTITVVATDLSGMKYFANCTFRKTE